MEAWVVAATIGLLVLVATLVWLGSALTNCEGFGVSEKIDCPGRCPSTHPYAFNGQGIEGGFCCRTSNITTSLAPQDYTQTCADNDDIRCPLPGPPCCSHKGLGIDEKRAVVGRES